jgi:hypothetical protein
VGLGAGLIFVLINGAVFPVRVRRQGAPASFAAAARRLVEPYCPCSRVRIPRNVDPQAPNQWGKQFRIVAEREGFELGGGIHEINNLLNSENILSPAIPLNPRIWQ